MIDLKYALKEFELYRQQYPDTPRINLKVNHMMRVMGNNIKLARKLELSNEDIALAGLIGMLHDIGRFKQVKIYDTFIDGQSINHAMFSSEQLFEKGLIKKFILDRQYDSIIKTAIENHNRFEIDNDVEGRDLLHAKLIRDADKMDIYVQVLESDPDLVFDGPYNPTDTIEPKVYEDFSHQRLVKIGDMKSKVDDLVRKVSFIYNIYFPQSLQMIQDQDLINRLTAYFKQSYKFSDGRVVPQIDEISSIANTYLSQINKKEIECR